MKIIITQSIAGTYPNDPTKTFSFPASDEAQEVEDIIADELIESGIAKAAEAKEEIKKKKKGGVV